jgi:hypothetical protein
MLKLAFERFLVIVGFRPRLTDYQQKCRAWGRRVVS